MSNVYIRENKYYEYRKEKFNPSKKYKELQNINIEFNNDIKVYDEIRRILIDMKLDEKNIGTDKWNPFSSFIKKGNNVVIKPNLVRHNNMNDKDTIDSVITNITFIRCALDYTILALGQTGKIIIGDSPVQECDFEKVIQINELKKMIEKYKEKFLNIELVDFRANNNPKIEGITIDLNKDSSLCELDETNGEYSIMNYDLKIMKEMHNKKNHSYIIPKQIIESDVIINLPKPKCHKKAGMTACMKNFVGTTARKECLPHHRTGSPNHHGDEFPENDSMKNFHAQLRKQTYKKNIIVDSFRHLITIILKKRNLLYYESGSWYGNDTIWRTILDLNKIICYSDKKGHMQKDKTRTIFNIADMIISGEKEGPLMPTSKKVGIIVAGFDCYQMDKVICKIMGFNETKIKYLNECNKENKYKLCTKEEKIYFNSKIISKNEIPNKKFIPASGWINYIER